MKLVQDCAGVLFFIHIDDCRPPITTLEAEEQAGRFNQEPGETSVVPWTPDSAPTQVVLVDLLQLLCTSPLSTGRSRRLTVLLSAWDLAEDEQLLPGEFLCNRFPLLHQYLQSAADYPRYKIYGISAQGGKLPELAGTLAAKERPSERIQVVEENGNIHHDLTIPIQWLVEQRNP